MEDHGCAKALHGDSSDTNFVGVAGGMGLLRYPAPDEGIGGSGSSPPGEGEEILFPDVDGVPAGLLYAPEEKMSIS